MFSHSHVQKQSLATDSFIAAGTAPLSATVLSFWLTVYPLLAFRKYGRLSRGT